MVVCNGCTDRTADVARGYGDGVRVIETPVASKTSALNLGDAAVSGFRGSTSMPTSRCRSPRFGGSPPASREGALAASPVMTVDLRGSGAAVRAYYRIWMRLPYVREGMIGVGVYALSEEGRGRFGAFPDVIADDGYVRMLFADGRARPRRRRAGARLRAREPVRPRAHQDPKPPRARTSSGSASPSSSRANEGRSPTEAPSGRSSCARGSGRPRPIYAAVVLRARRRARMQLASIDSYVWERDHSSRRDDEALTRNAGLGTLTPCPLRSLRSTGWPTPTSRRGTRSGTRTRSSTARTSIPSSRARSTSRGPRSTSSSSATGTVFAPCWRGTATDRSSVPSAGREPTSRRRSHAPARPSTPSSCCAPPACAASSSTTCSRCRASSRWIESRRESPYVEVAGGMDGYLARASRSGKDNLGQARRKARKAEAAHGPITFVAESTDAGALDAVIALKRAQYAATGARDYFAAPERVALRPPTARDPGRRLRRDPLHRPRRADVARGAFRDPLRRRSALVVPRVRPAVRHLRARLDPPAGAHRRCARLSA